MDAVGTVESEEDEGSTVLKELENKYLCDEDFDSSILLNSMTGSSPRKLASQRALELLVLDHRAIQRVGDINRLALLVKNVTELDLSWNRLESWDEVSILLSNLSSLQTLNVSHNPLSRVIQTSLPVAQRLFSLVLNDTNLPISTIRQVILNMPSLRELHLSENRLIEKDVDLEDHHISESVEVLHLNRCQITTWSTAIRIFWLLPFCETLFLSENPITAITAYPDIGGDKMIRIRKLNMNRSGIDEWKSIESLAEIQTLKDLMINQIPLLASYNEEERMNLVVGRMPHLDVLNGSEITDRSREEAERFCIRYYDLCETKPNFLLKLVARHGKIEKLCDVDLSPKMRARVLAICEETGYRAHVSLNLSQSVGALMRAFEKITGIPSSRMRIFYRKVRGAPFPEELRFHNQKLSSLLVEDGDQFHVQAKLIFQRPKKTGSR